MVEEVLTSVNQATQSNVSQSSSEWMRNKLTISQRFDQEFAFEDIHIKQSPHTEPPSCVYDAAIVLAKFIEKNIGSLQQKKIIELGAGCGFTSIYLTKKLNPLKSIITDLSSVHTLIQENIDLNKCSSQQVICKELFWGSQDHINAVLEKEDQFDLILGSDLLYDFEYFPELVETLNLLYIKGKSQILFCYTHRFSDVEKWFREELEKKGFKYQFAKTEEFDPKFCDSEKIHVLKIFK